jgi:hypothetical protein
LEILIDYYVICMLPAIFSALFTAGSIGISSLSLSFLLTSRSIFVWIVNVSAAAAAAAAA